MQAQNDPGKSLGIAGMICGIIGIIFSIFLAPVGIVLAIVGIVLGALGMKKQSAVGRPAGMAIAGLVCGLVALPIALICTACVWCPAYRAVNAGLDILDTFAGW